MKKKQTRNTDIWKLKSNFLYEIEAGYRFYSENLNYTYAKNLFHFIT